MKRVKNSIGNFIKKRKILSLIILVAVFGAAHWAYGKVFSKAAEVSYIQAAVKRGDIVSTITGTGQVTASSQIDIKSKVSGDLVYLNTKANGTQVTKGTLIAQVDARDASIALESAKIAYEKLTKSASAGDILKAESALNDAIATNKKSYEDAFSTIANTFIDLPSIMNGLNDMLYTSSGYLDTESVRNAAGNTGLVYRDKAGVSFDSAKKRYDAMVVQYKNLSRSSDATAVESFLTDTYLLVKDVSEALKNIQNAVEYIRKQKNDSSGNTPASNISTWTATANTDLNNLLSVKTVMLSSATSIKEKNIDLADLKDGPDSLDIRSEKLSLQQKENAYQEYFIRAPFDGMLARLAVKPTDSVSGGTVIGTLVSSQKISTITLNEVDVERVKVGQKAHLTFDAISELTIPGTVITVDLVGTVSQGVVNYNVEIALDTQDDRVKSGMSVTAEIVTDTKADVVIVPNSAVKTQGRLNYVEVLTPSSKTPIQKPVTIGVSNDTFTEIISGINEGDQAIVRTITPVAGAKPTASAPSLFSGSSATRIGGGGGGNAVRVTAPRN